MKVARWRSMGCRCASLGIMGAVWAVPSIASAELPRYRVELQAPKYLPNCNDLPGFIEELDLALGHSLLGSPASRVLEVRIDRPPGGRYAVDVVIKDIEGHALSTLVQTHAGSMECFKVLHKVAFVAAVEMEKDLPPEPVETPPPPPACPPPSPAKSPHCPAPIAPTSLPAPRKRGFIGLGVGALLNVAPEAFFAPHLRVGWYVRPRVALELDFTGQAWTTTRPNDGPTIVDVKTGLATVAGCYAPGSLLLCGLLSTELRHASSGEEVQETKILPSFGFRASYEQVLVRPLSIRTNLDAFVYLRDRDIATRTTILWQPTPVATNLTTSLVLTF